MVINIEPNGSAKINNIVEKPTIDQAPSNLAVVGRYVFSASIWGFLENPIGVGDEIQLTDAIDMLIEKETVEAFYQTGKNFDCGDKIGYMQAFVEYGIHHPQLGEKFKQYLKELVKSL